MTNRFVSFDSALKVGPIGGWENQRPMRTLVVAEEALSPNFTFGPSQLCEVCGA
jgi:hypothetical protein